MATTGTVYQDDSFKGQKGGVIVVGRVLLGNNAMIDAQSFGLRTIKSVQFDPFFQRNAMGQGSIGSLATKLYERSFAVMTGSIGSVDSLGNYVRVRSYVMRTLGSITARAAAPQGTRGLYIGTQAGSVRASYIAWGR